MSLSVSVSLSPRSLVAARFGIAPFRAAAILFAASLVSSAALAREIPFTSPPESTHRSPSPKRETLRPGESAGV